MPGECQLRLNLQRCDAEIQVKGKSGSLHDYSGEAWRRLQHTAVNQEAYQLYYQLSHQMFQDITYAGIPLLPLLQRYLTETFVEAFEQVIKLQAFLTAEQPATIYAETATTAFLTRIAAQRTQNNVTIIDAYKRHNKFYRHVVESIARSSIYLSRIYRLQREKPVIPPPISGQPRLVFHPYYPNHLPSFMPLIEKLKTSGRYDVWVAGADTNTLRRGDIDPTPLHALGVPYVPFETAVSRSYLLRSMVQSVYLPTQISRKLRAADSWQQGPIDNATRPFIQAVLVDLLETRLPKILLYLDLASVLYQAIQPDLVIVTDETLPILGRIALRTAQQQQIPTLTIQHGLLLDDPMYFGSAVADRFAIWGGFSRDFLVTNGCPPQKLSMVGSSRFSQPDSTLSPLPLQTMLNLPLETRVVLFTSQPGGRDVTPQANQATFAALATAVSQLPHCHLLIKPHPAQTEAELMTWQQLFPTAPVTIQRNIPLHPAMLGADVCVSVFSTTGLEALWLDRPLLTINLTDKPDLIPYAAAGAAVSAQNEADVFSALQQALDPIDQQNRAPARRRFVERYLGQLDGRSLDRLTSLIDEMVS